VVNRAADCTKNGPSLRLGFHLTAQYNHHQVKNQSFLLTMLRYAIYPLIQGRIKVGHRLLLRTQARYGGWSPACILIWFESVLFILRKTKLTRRRITLASISIKRSEQLKYETIEGLSGGCWKDFEGSGRSQYSSSHAMG
jgi:hypothetical protein